MAQLYTFGKSHFNHNVIELVRVYITCKTKYDEHEKNLKEYDYNILNGINSLENLEVHRNELVSTINELYIKLSELCKDLIQATGSFCNFEILFDLVKTKDDIEKLKIQAKEELIIIEEYMENHGFANAETMDKIEENVEEKWTHFLSLIPKIKDKFICDSEMEDFFKDDDIVMN